MAAGSERDHWSKVEAEIKSGIVGSKIECPNYPCHFDGQDCSLCFCPFYPCKDPELGKFITSKKGIKVWSCKDCFWVHRPDVAKVVLSLLRPEMSTEEALDLKASVEKHRLKNARTIMVMGSTSGAGKSLTVAALCRIFADRDLRVTPFKSQNMSLNSVVTTKGEEIARAQSLQAAAARMEPNVHMNPILLKPKKDDVSQVIVEGHPYMDMNVDQYFSSFTLKEGVGIIQRNYDLLRRTHDIIVVEGAGSPAEINIADQEIANMRTAEITNASCILVVNIEWGGAFAYIYGTLNLLKPQWKAMFKGVIINNMRGDSSSLRSGIEIIERETGVPVLGVVPHFDHSLPSEDSMTLRSFGGQKGTIVGVVRLPRISNFTDFDALALETNVSVRFIDTADELDSVDAIIIPGTKNSILDILWMKENGIFERIKEKAGCVPILGVCGGYQMLGSRLVDAQGLEGDTVQDVEGLGLLNAITYFDTYDKRTVQVKGDLLVGDGGAIRGYEIHMGKTASEEKSLFSIVDHEGRKLDGSVSADGLVMGTYLHGVFDLPPFRRHFLGLVSRSESWGEGEGDYDSSLENGLDQLARTVEENIDMKSLLGLLRLGG